MEHTFLEQENDVAIRSLSLLAQRLNSPRGSSNAQTCPHGCREGLLAWFKHERAAISDGLKSCSTVTREWIKAISSRRDLSASAASSCAYVFPRKFICVGAPVPHLCSSHKFPVEKKLRRKFESYRS